MADETDIDELRERLADMEGTSFWRGLEEVAGTETFRSYLHREFPREASRLGSEIDRRNFMKLSAASLALAGIAGCEPEQRDKIIPYVEKPEEVVPGEPLFFASTFQFGGVGQGVLVEDHTGRPTKIEGNPDHPTSDGATTAHSQASVLTLYDPDRSKVTLEDGETAGWSAFQSEMRTRRQRLQASGGEGFHLLTGAVTSPTLVAQIERLLEQLPGAQWHVHEPVGDQKRREGARRVFGEVVVPRIRFERTAVVASFDADFLGVGPGQLAQSRKFRQIRRVRDGGSEQDMGRLYSVESAPSLTGANADHTQAMRPREVEQMLRAVAARVGVAGAEAPDELPVDQKFVEALAGDLQDNAGESAVLVGEPQPPRVHALGNLLNDELGNLGRTVELIEPVEARPGEAGSLGELAERLEAGEVGTLAMLACNPVYTAPADIPFGELLDGADTSVHLGLFVDETAEQCDWHIPRSHFLESWGDARAWNGTASVRQPTIERLYNTRSAHELLAQFLGETDKPAREIVNEYWKSRWDGRRPGESFQTGWQRTLEEGVVPGTARRPVDVQVRQEFTPEAPPESEGADEGLTVVFRPDPSVWDGRFANNAWLQELPKPMTSLTWDNAALVSPRTAEQLEVSDEEVVELTYEGESVRAPVKVLPGHPDGTVTCRLGYGRGVGGRVAVDVGFDAYRLRRSDALWAGRGLEVEKTGDDYLLASTQHHHAMEGREIVRVQTFQQFLETEDAYHASHASMHPEWSYEGDYEWAMVIDQTLCTGCKACVTACQAENNIPVVGKQQVARGREMHWIRVDNYYAGDLDDPDQFHQPVPCMHCENAPCEVVCPVSATSHSDEGINEMTYNRCIGTRYCSNNCPYKVRRFNFLDYEERPATADLQYNPDVTVRERGVMEKCTYCIQRINDARQQAKAEDRPIGGDEVTTACQSACPTDAIVFGDKNNPNSQVATLKEQSHEYSLLAELSTQPRTTYLAAIRHPHPDLDFDAVEATQIESGGDGDGEEAEGAESDDVHGGE